MTGIEIRRREEYDFATLMDNGAALEVMLFIAPEMDTKKRHLIEEKIDLLFDEVNAIMNDTADHTL